MLWKVKGQTVEPIQNTKFSEQQLQERDLETWIESNPDILGEPLMFIGRQVVVPGVNDRLDLLALDPTGDTVIIEIKRGKLNDPVDIQAIRYASYISRWPKRKLEELADAYLSQHGGEDNGATFEEAFAEFASDIDTEGVSSLNGRQRIIIVGQKIRTRLGSVALWLREQGIDIKIIEITPFKDTSSDSLILSPQVIIPPPTTEEFEIGKKDSATDPWIVDGEKWHLEKRCKPKGRELLLAFIEQLRQRFTDATGPVWNQKQYVSFRLGSAIWLYLNTQATQFRLHIPVPPDRWDAEELAARLGIVTSSKDDSLAEKLSAPTGVRIRKRKNRKAILFFIKDDGLFAEDEFWKALSETHDDFLKGW